VLVPAETGRQSHTGVKNCALCWKRARNNRIDGFS
jgi:hypothetical protein